MKRIVVLLAVLALAACQEMLLDKPYQPTPVQYGPSTERQVEAASQRFASLMAAQNADAIAGAYSPDGVWERQSGPLRGRDAIRTALAANTGVRVLSFGMRTEYITYNGPAVVHTGEFTQSAQLPNGKTASNIGKFEATWVRGPRGEWWIHRMIFRPK
ncbi:MAG: YybH family protein [Micropepsaceae bacterium]